MTLNKLIERGFVTFVKEGKRNHYQAANPNHIIDFINEKRERFPEILPELLLQQKQAKEKPEIITFRGINGMKELLLELLEAGGKKRISYFWFNSKISYAWRCLVMLGGLAIIKREQKEG